MNPEQIISRLYRAGAADIEAIVAPLSQAERARLAVFCYARAHLRGVGLAIADACDLAHLVEATGSSATAQTLFAQAQNKSMPTERLANSRRPVTLATAATAAKLVASEEFSDFDDEEIADDELEDLGEPTEGEKAVDAHEVEEPPRMAG